MPDVKRERDQLERYRDALEQIARSFPDHESEEIAREALSNCTPRSESERRAWDAAVLKDADRYRWLRSEEVATDPVYYEFWNEFDAKLTREGRLDDLIDRWMGK